jgi:hypothetical protein
MTELLGVLSREGNSGRGTTGLGWAAQSNGMVLAMFGAGAAQSNGMVLAVFGAGTCWVHCLKLRDRLV